MDTFESPLKLIKQYCFKASKDLRHVYYSILIAYEHSNGYGFFGDDFF